MEAEVVVIGAGIAGASLAAELAAKLAGDRSVVLLEQESQPGYHTTGRSAALFSKSYGPPAIRALSRASESFFKAPPSGFCDHPLLALRGTLIVARADQDEELAAVQEDCADAKLVALSKAEALARLPLLRGDYVQAALWEAESYDIDVNALHQGYLRMLKAKGGRLICNAEVLGLERSARAWRVETKAGPIVAESLVNAAGAWAGAIGEMAGASAIGLQPKRRTAMIVAAPPDCAVAELCMSVDIDEQFYLRPEAGKLLISPADETPSPPCDAQPDELDIAICVDRIERAYDLQVRQIERKWAGLRSFVADKAPVVGWDPACPGFFWLAGQGGYGIQTAPALAKLAADLVCHGDAATEHRDHGLDPRCLAPGRLA